MEIMILLVNVALCVWVGASASNRGRCFWGWFILSLLISPILGGIGLLIAGDKAVANG